MSAQTPVDLAEVSQPNEEPTYTIEPANCSRESTVDVPLLMRSVPGGKHGMARADQFMQAITAVANSHDSMRQIAQQMREHRLVVLPVLESGEIVGVITDRDILLRSVALGEDPIHDLVADVMTCEAHCCYADEEVWRAAELMHKRQVRQVGAQAGWSAVVGGRARDCVAASF